MLIMSHQSDKGHLPHLARVFSEKNIPYNWVVSNSWKILGYVTFSKTQKQLFFSLRRLQICPYCSSVIHLGTWGSRYVGSFKTNDFLQILTYTAIVCQYENKNSHTNWKRTHFHYMLCCKTNLFNSHQHKKLVCVCHFQKDRWTSIVCEIQSK